VVGPHASVLKRSSPVRRKRPAAMAPISSVQLSSVFRSPAGRGSWPSFSSRRRARASARVCRASRACPHDGRSGGRRVPGMPATATQVARGGGQPPGALPRERPCDRARPPVRGGSPAVPPAVPRRRRRDVDGPAADQEQYPAPVQQFQRTARRPSPRSQAQGRGPVTRSTSTVASATIAATRRSL
jgi:hypothetical protein